MNGLYILIPDTSHMLAAEHPPREMSTPALSDDTGSSSSRESSRPATPTSGHTPSGEGTDFRIVEADADSSPLEDITRPLKRRRFADTRADEVRAERALLPNIWSDAPRVDGGACFGLGHIRISDCTSVGDVEPDTVDPSLEYVSRPLKRKRSADTSTYDVRAKRARTSGTSNDATKAEDRACFGLGHISIHDYTKIRVVEPDADPPVAPGIDIHVPLDAIARPPKRKRCADTTVDEGNYHFGLVADKAALQDDCTMLCMPTNYNAFCCNTPANIIFLRRDLRILWETNRLLMIPHPGHIDHPDTRPVYTYHVITEDEQPLDLGTPQDYTIIPLATTADCSYRSLGWHELSANLHLMTIRVGREFMRRPLRYEHVFRMDALVHIPIVQLAQPDAAEPVSPHIERESPKLSKRPFHYRHILRELLPHKEINHTYEIVSRYKSWMAPLHREIVRGRRLWATGELAPFPDGYFRCFSTPYCSPLPDDDAVRFPLPFRPLVSGMKRKRSGDTRADIEIYTAKEDARREVSVRQWCRDCDQARDEWTMGPPAEPTDAELLAYRQEDASNVLPAAQKSWLVENYFAKWQWTDTDTPDPAELCVAILAKGRDVHRAIGCISELPSGRRGNYMHGPCEMPNNVFQPSVLVLQVTIPSHMAERGQFRPYVDQPLGIGSSYGNLLVLNRQEAAVNLLSMETASMCSRWRAFPQITFSHSRFRNYHEQTLVFGPNLDTTWEKPWPLQFKLLYACQCHDGLMDLSVQYSNYMLYSQNNPSCIYSSAVGCRKDQTADAISKTIWRSLYRSIDFVVSQAKRLHTDPTDEWRIGFLLQKWEPSLEANYASFRLHSDEFHWPIDRVWIWTPAGSLRVKNRC
ncbi:predicted protein [Postia placenta Mad-698-R]|nr:predicted protein [Postia placenta Mad-698-R]